MAPAGRRSRGAVLSKQVGGHLPRDRAVRPGDAQRPAVARAVVSRGGRPDLADAALPDVQAPTLLIVGARDEPVIEMNQAAMDRMSGAHVELRIVPGATHLFEEPGTLEEVEQLAGDWFLRYLRP